MRLAGMANERERERDARLGPVPVRRVPSEINDLGHHKLSKNTQTVRWVNVVGQRERRHPAGSTHRWLSSALMMANAIPCKSVCDWLGARHGARHGEKDTTQSHVSQIKSVFTLQRA